MLLMATKAGLNIAEQNFENYDLFQQVSTSFNNDLIPVRMPYSADEDTLNNKNYV